MILLLTEQIERQIQKDLVESFLCGEYLKGVAHVRKVLDDMYAAIPEKKRISHGRYTTIKTLAEKLFEEFEKANLPVLEIGATILNSTKDYRTMGVGLGILALYGVEDYQSVLPYFESAAQLVGSKCFGYRSKDTNWNAAQYVYLGWGTQLRRI